MPVRIVIDGETRACAATDSSFGWTVMPRTLFTDGNGRLRFLVFLLTALLCLSFPSGAWAQSRVLVRGKAIVEAHTVREKDHIRIRGTVLDDNAAPIAHAAILFEFPGDGARAVPCTSSSESDDGGQFCADVLDLKVGRSDASVTVTPNTTLYDPVTIPIMLELGKPTVSLSFLKLPRAVYLGDVVPFIVRAEAEDGAAIPHLPIDIALDGKTLREAQTDESGELSLTLGREFEDPGTIELRARFKGNDAFAEDKSTRILEKRARVSLRLADGEDARLAKGIDPDGLRVDVEAHDLSAWKPEGQVELLLDDVPERVFPMHAGKARIEAAFEPRKEDVTLTFRFLPASRFVETTNALTVTAAIRSRSQWTRALLLFLPVLAVALFLFRRPPKQVTTSATSPDVAPLPRREPSVALIETGAAGFSGRVVDLHERYPIAGARVWMEKKRFAALETVASTTTDEHGRFELPSTSGKDLQISAEGPFHRSLRKPAPGPGTIEISLASRKRAILEQLVLWARQSGPPYDARPEATPGHVAKIAGTGGAAPWAQALERAAYAPGDVDALIEASVDALKPGVDKTIGQAQPYGAAIEFEPGLAQAEEGATEIGTDPKNLGLTRRGFF